MNLCFVSACAMQCSTPESRLLASLRVLVYIVTVCVVVLGTQSTASKIPFLQEVFGYTMISR